MPAAALGYAQQYPRARLHRPLVKPLARLHDFCPGKRTRPGLPARAVGLIFPRSSKPPVPGKPDMLNKVSSNVAGRSLDVGQERLHQARRRQLQSGAGAGDRRGLGLPLTKARGPALRRHGDLRRDPGERPRLGRLHHPVDLVPGQRPSDGAADHHRRAAPLVGAPHHRGDPLFRLCPAGPQIRLAHADLGQARRQSDHRRPASTAS